MNWEVSSMQSKRSFFNKTLFRKNLTRFWPLWGGMSIAGALIPLYMVLMLTTDMSHGRHPEPGDFAEVLYSAVTFFAPAFIMGYAILCAMLVWGYLYSPRAVGLMHTLPVDRTCLFVTNTVSGLTMIAVPFAVVGGLMSLVALIFGFFHPVAFVNTVAAVVFMALLFFGLATLCAMLTGHNAVLPVLYLLVNFLAEIVEFLLAYMNSQFLMGVASPNVGRFLFLTPVLQIYANFHSGYPDVPEAEAPVLSGLGTVALYGLAGLGLLALAWLLYRKRQSERAGDVVAYRPLRPVFRYGVALLSALTLGQLLYELLWDAIFHNGWALTADLIPTMVCMAIVGVIGYYIASMLLEKSLRVFKGSWRGVATVCAGVVILCGVVSMDPLGLESKLPELDDIEHISIMSSMDLNINPATEEGRKMAEQALDIHRAILADKTYISRSMRQREGFDGEDGMRYGGIWIRYTMRDGPDLVRHYQLPFSDSRLRDTSTYDGKLYQLANSEEALMQSVKIPQGNLMHVNVYACGKFIEGGDASQQLYEAMLQDAREGRVDGHTFPWWEDDELESREWYEVELEIIYNIPSEGGSDTGGNHLSLHSGMIHTIDALVEEGYFTLEEMHDIKNGDYDFLNDELG